MFYSTKGDYIIRLRGSSLGFRRLSRRILFSPFVGNYTHVSNDSSTGSSNGATASPSPSPGPVVNSSYPLGWVDCVEDSAIAASKTDPVQHNEILCYVPTGIGANLSVGVFVGTDDVQASDLMPFSYDPPEIAFVQPDPLDANGQTLTFYGTNLADANGVSCVFGPFRACRCGSARRERVNAEDCVRVSVAVIAVRTLRTLRR